MSLPARTDVLFVAYGGGHIAKVAPVVRALRARGLHCTVIALTVGYPVALQLGLTPLGYRDFMHLVDAPRALALGRGLLEGNRHPQVDEHESCCYLGVNYLEWVDTLGEDAARDRYASVGRRGFYPLQFMGRVVDALQPGVVVSTASPRSEQALLEAAAARGIPSVTIMDLFALPYDPYLRQPFKADVITVMSEFVRGNLVAAGVPAQRVRVTGCPAYDALQEPAQAAAGRAWRQAMGWDRLQVVMWAGYKEEGPDVPPHWQGVGFGLEVERRLRDWVGRSPDRALLVRYHPNQYHDFPVLPAQPRVYVAQAGREPVQPQLHASDVVIVQTSTVGLEAALIGKRVINLSCAPSVIELGFDFSRMGLAEGVDDLEALVPALAHPARGGAAAAGFPPAPAAPRVAAEIAALLPAARAQG